MSDRFKYIPTRFMLPISHYSEKYSDYAVAFIETLTHTKGEFSGKPFKLFSWQEQIVRDLFGILKPNGYSRTKLGEPFAPGTDALLAQRYLLLKCESQAPPDTHK